MSSGIISGFALSAFVSVTPTNQVYADPTSEAVKHAGKAIYKQFDIDKYVKNIEKRYINKTVLEYGGVIGVGVRIVTEQQISYVWRF